MKWTPETALALLRKALAADSVRVTDHARNQAEAAGFSLALILAELRLAARRGTVGRNDSQPERALAYGNFLALAFGRDGQGNRAVVVTAFIIER
jgi:hypothetical protein